MNELVSHLIENIGIQCFKVLNKKKTEDSLFRDCHEIDSTKIQSIYSNVQVFERCNSYNTPTLISTHDQKKLQIETYKTSSMYQPIDVFKELSDSFDENKAIFFEKVSTKASQSGEKICFIYLHGFSERSYAMEIKYLFNQLLEEMPTLEILAVHLPYHMKRSPSKQPYSGAYLFDSYPIITIEGIRQAVNDVSQILAYARNHYQKVIVGGFSLGGFVTSFLGTCDDRGDLYVMGQAGAHLPNTLKHLKVCPGLYEKMKEWVKQGIHIETLYKPIELLNYHSIIQSEKVVSIAGNYDKLVDYDSVTNLRDFYKSHHNIDYLSGHIGFLLETNRVKKEVMKIIDKQVVGSEK